MRDELSPYARLIDCVPDGYTPVGFVAAIEALDADGDHVLMFSTSEDLPIWKSIGMVELLKSDLHERTRARVFEAEDEDD